MMGLLQYKAKSQKPYVTECVKQVLISAASVCINRMIAEGCCSKLTLLSDLFLLTKWPSSVILFMQTSDSHMNVLPFYLCSLSDSGCSHFPPCLVFTKVQKWFILLYSPWPDYKAFSFDLMLFSCNSARPEHFGVAARFFNWFPQRLLYKA